MKKILVFGATGSIGAYFVDYCKSNLDRSEYEIIAVGRKDTRYFSENDIEYIQVDLTDGKSFTKLPTSDVYAIVHLSGLLPAYTSEFDPYSYIDVNITGSLRILEYARKNGVDRILYTQTWSEQGGYWGKSEVLSPDMPRKLIYTGDHAFYAITKTTVVEMMEHYKQEYGIKNFVFRLPNVYMYHPEKYYYVDGVKRYIGYRHMIDRAINGENMEIWGNPDAFKDILYIKDLCQMMYRALSVKRDGGTYNAGTGIKTTLREQINGIVEVFSPAGKEINIVCKPEKPGFVSFVMDIRNAEEELGYKPEYTYIEYLRDYKKEMEQRRFDSLWS